MTDHPASHNSTEHFGKSRAPLATASPTEASRGRSAPDASGVLHGACESLRQGRELLEKMDANQYGRSCPQAFDATIGQHFRHCLDHFDMFLRQIDLGEINYDLRERQPGLETSPIQALDKIRVIEKSIGALSESRLSCTVNLLAGVGENTVYLCETTVARELYYVTAHAIHHYALIAVIANHLELELPVNFGVAPSTVAYLATRTRA